MPLPPKRSTSLPTPFASWNKRGLVSAYGSDTTLPEILQIIAECVFENIETPKLVSPAADYPRVVSYQRQWISRQESIPGLPKTMFKSLTDSVTAS